MAASAAGWIEAARRIVAAVRASDVAELELVHGDFRLLVRREIGALSPTPPADASKPSVDETHLHRIVAPLTGVFYRSASPTARPYVEEGDWVDADTVIGLVETMKIFNEVTADRAGKVVRFASKAGQLVHAGDPLVLIEPGARKAAAPETDI